VSTSRLDRLRLLLRRLPPGSASFIIVLLVFFGALVVQRLGWLQFLEFHVYDAFLRRQVRAASSDPIVLVEMRESDIQNPTLDYPLYDNKLAELLRILERGQPAAIGLDIWRDVPVPKSGVYLSEFEDVLQKNTNIIAIFTLGGIQLPIQPPRALKSSPDRLGFNDNFPPDVDVDRTVPKVRRSELYRKVQGEVVYALPFQLALLYLDKKGIQTEPDPSDPHAIRLGKGVLRPLDPNDGPYVRADVGAFEILLDFKCPDRFPRYSVTEALEGKIPDGALQDKIILIGMNTPSVADERVTPLRRDHRGIEVQALTINQLLRCALRGDRTLRFWPNGLEDVWMLVWCIVGGAIGYFVRSPWRLAPLSACCLASIGGAAWVAFGLGWWIPAISPAVAYVPALALVTSYVSAQEKMQRGQLMQLFSKQVSPDIAQALWEQREDFLAGQRPRSQKLMATVLFTDLVGFSSTSEKLEPAVLMDWLNDYMDAMATIVMAHQGVVEKYIGDAIMAVFGVPLARTTEEEISQDASNAVRCALAMRAQMSELNKRWPERGWPLAGMRIGIHTGPLVAGTLGSSERQEYTVLGDSVNTASRLESFDKGWEDPSGRSNSCRILISEGTALLLHDRFETCRVGTMLLKNKATAVTIYSVVGETSPHYEDQPKKTVQ
jgi:adenylate cyclase